LSGFRRYAASIFDAIERIFSGADTATVALPSSRFSQVRSAAKLL